MVSGGEGLSPDLLKLLKTWARHAASGDLGATISPLANTGRKGGACIPHHEPTILTGGWGWGHGRDRQHAALKPRELYMGATRRMKAGGLNSRSKDVI
ncbi:hypothetical protein THAOC_02113 [Thalassiosira oceanica]|uniref:Uncharacterized protein n=1 Tax=Thalassiosira oceanica TaxID=159749 RepID=K0TME9_THAOC|nr:hypothetical protein THAOC_02113 [Thalassiosira oceanica]|eukprot:EJK76146.1 hypothetical protein THAOC_02113 [Thalassiosira oceanica]